MKLWDSPMKRSRDQIDRIIIHEHRIVHQKFRWILRAVAGTCRSLKLLNAASKFLRRAAIPFYTALLHTEAYLFACTALLVSFLEKCNSTELLNRFESTYQKKKLFTSIILYIIVCFLILFVRRREKNHHQWIYFQRDGVIRCWLWGKKRNESRFVC